MRIVIIGNGVAGITCAMTARERDPNAKITVISGETEYFFSRTALMYAYMDLMQRRDLEPYERKDYRAHNIDLVKDWVVNCNAESKFLTLESGQRIPYDKLVYAVGASPNMFHWDGVEHVKDGIVHFVSMQDLDACERLTPSTQRAVVIGGGLIGIELVECLRHHGVEVTFLVREPFYWPIALSKEEATYVTDEMRDHGVDIRLQEEMTRMEVDAEGRIAAIHTNKGEKIECQMLGIAVGVHPNTKRIKAFDHAPEMGRGIITNAFLETSLPDVYACGDCAEIHREGHNPLNELIWYSAKRQGKLAAHNVFGDQKAYDPPLFFNSSKFFEIEYTTVGEVVQLPTGTPSIYLKVPKKRISARIVHDGTKVLGFNMLGSRWNHEVLENWVENEKSPEYVVQNLHEAQFDVEFGRIHFDQVKRQDIPIVFFREAS